MKWEKQNLHKILTGRIDASHGLNAHSLLYEAKILNLDQKIKVLKLPEPADRGYIVFAKNEKGKKILKQFNQAIKKLKMNYDHYLQNEFDLIK